MMMKLACLVVLIVLVAVHDVRGDRGGRGGRGGGRRGPRKVICAMTYTDSTGTKSCNDTCPTGPCDPQALTELPECIANAVAQDTSFSVDSFSNCTEAVPTFPTCDTAADCQRQGGGTCEAAGRRGNKCTCSTTADCSSDYTCVGHWRFKTCLANSSCKKVLIELKNKNRG